MYLLDSNNGIHNISDSEIICIEISRPNLYYRTKSDKFRAPRTLNDYKLIYEHHHFIQIDKKKIVNVLLADKIEKGHIYFGDLKYPISRRKEAKVKELMDKTRGN